MSPASIVSAVCRKFTASLHRVPCPPQDEQQLAALRSMGVAGAVQHLLQTTTGLGRLLRRAPVLVSLRPIGRWKLPALRQQAR